MKHLSELELVLWASGQVPAGNRPELARHIEQCPECAARARELTQSWALLGQWTPQAPEVDLTAAVLAQVRQEARSHTVVVPLRRWVWPMTKLAAAVALAAGVGHTAGRLSWQPPAPINSAPVDQQQVLADLQLNVLGSLSPAGLAAAMDSLHDAVDDAAKNEVNG